MKRVNQRRKIKKTFGFLIDLILFPFNFIFACIFWIYRRYSLTNFPITRQIFLKIGVMPIIDHYFEPLFNPKHIHHPFNKERFLPGVNFNELEQLEILSKFDFNEELLSFPIEPSGKTREFFYNNPAFPTGDAEYLYNMIRLYKPSRIIEVGSGYSTLMVDNALRKNRSEMVDYHCVHFCIEPYEQPWLEEIGVNVFRKKIEELGLDIFATLEQGDLLIIDSTHIIRSQGDVLFTYLEVLPILKKGVIVFIHDIFSPRDYPEQWFGEHLWNEQYLVEAFLSYNPQFKIIGAANFLFHKYPDEFKAKHPVTPMKDSIEPSALFLEKC